MALVNETAQTLTLTDPNRDSVVTSTVTETFSPKTSKILEEKMDNTSNTVTDPYTRPMKVKRKIMFDVEPVDKDSDTKSIDPLSVQLPKIDDTKSTPKVNNKEASQAAVKPEAPAAVCAARQKLSDKLSELINKVESRTGKKADEVTDDQEEGDEDEMDKPSIDEEFTADSSGEFKWFLIHLYFLLLCPIYRNE